jgi:flagellar export protein FliJ
MAKRRVLERLLRLRELEEELSRVDLETAVGARNRLAGELAAAAGRQAQAHRGFAASLGDPDTADRTGAVIAMERACKQRLRIEPRLRSAEQEVMRQREEFLARRTGRQQVETLLEQEHRTQQEEVARRAQQMLDDWYGRRPPVQRNCYPRWEAVGCPPTTNRPQRILRASLSSTESGSIPRIAPFP